MLTRVSFLQQKIISNGKAQKIKNFIAGGLLNTATVRNSGFKSRKLASKKADEQSKKH